MIVSFFSHEVFDSAKNDENSNIYKFVRQILQKNCSGKLITIQEVFFRLMGQEYFTYSRQFVRIDVSSQIMNRDGSSKVPDYINAYLNRPNSLIHVSLYDFMKGVIVNKNNLS